MQLVSVNISQAHEIEYNGKLISTGIFKQAVNTSVEVQPLQIVGDQQVDLLNHGGEHKAVYGFSANHYDYWRKALNKPELHFGQFGENLTISDLDENLLCIGDQLQIGSVILEVTQPRVPCFKLGIAIGLKTMPKLFIEHGMTGIYFRVIQTGEINTQDAVKIVKQHSAQLSVATLFAAYFDKEIKDAADILTKALTINALSNEWQQKLEQRLNTPPK